MHREASLIPVVLAATLVSLPIAGHIVHLAMMGPYVGRVSLTPMQYSIPSQTESLAAQTAIMSLYLYVRQVAQA